LLSSGRLLHVVALMFSLHYQGGGIAACLDGGGGHGGACHVGLSVGVVTATLPANPIVRFPDSLGQVSVGNR
jgi:hypothetical protein